MEKMDVDLTSTTAIKASTKEEENPTVTIKIENQETDTKTSSETESISIVESSSEKKKQVVEQSVKKEKEDTSGTNPTTPVDSTTIPNKTENETNIDSINDSQDKRASHLSHASRRVILHNIYKWARPNEIKRLLDSIQSILPSSTSTTTTSSSDNKIPPLTIEKFKKPPRQDWMAITFETEIMAKMFMEGVNTNATTKLKKQKGQKKPLFARMAASDGMGERNCDNDNNRGRRIDGRKRGRDWDSNQNDNDGSIGDSQGRDGDDGNDDDEEDELNKKRKKREFVLLDEDGVRDSMTPLWRKPYEYQLMWKWRQMVNKCTKKIVQELKSTFKNRQKEARRNKNVKLFPIYPWITENRAIPVLPILPSPQTMEYRNKVELTFGYTYEKGEDSNENIPATNQTTEYNNHQKPIPIVGFTTQGWSGPLSHPHPCQNIPREAIKIANIINDFLSTSPIPPYNSRVHRGVWRILTLRFSRRTKECMVLIQHAPPSGGAGKRDNGEDNYMEVWEKEKDRLIQMLTTENDMMMNMPVPEFPEVVYQNVEKMGGNEEENKRGGPSHMIADFPMTSNLVTGNVQENHRHRQNGSGTGKNNNNTADFSGIKVTSIYFQEYEGLSNPRPEHPVQHVYGKHAITERLGKCDFQISPGAFFQVNTEGAEVLYDVVVQKVKEVTCAHKDKSDKKNSNDCGGTSKKALLFDVCCGTGTIGLTCMKEGIVDKVIGVDISEPAIRDAIRNANLNGYTHQSSDCDDDTERKSRDATDNGTNPVDEEMKNVPTQSEKQASSTKFIASRAELVLAKELKQVKTDSDGYMIVAVVDPAREGLHNDVIKALRANEGIQRLIYVSCNPSGTLVKDAAMLCGPPTKKYPGKPFRPTSAQPVDMFPLTNHCEMVMVFDRMTEDDHHIEKKKDIKEEEKDKAKDESKKEESAAKDIKI